MDTLVMTQNVNLQIYGWLPTVRDTLGPGNRAVVWVQGCTLHCPDCMVPETWDPNAGFPVDPVQLGNEIGTIPDIEGVTVSGGEPFQQPDAVAPLLEKVKQAGRNTWVYTGYTIEDLIGFNNPAIDRLLTLVDVLVDGPFHEGQEVRRFRGSSNQRMISLTGAIPADRIASGGESRIELNLDTLGRLVLVGIPPRGFLQAFREKMRQHGLAIKEDNF